MNIFSVISFVMFFFEIKIRIVFVTCFVSSIQNMIKTCSAIWKASKKCRLFHQDGIFLMMSIILPVAIPATESCILERAIAASCASSVQAPEQTAGLGLCRVWH